MALLDDLEQELKILKQTRKQSTKEGQPNAKKTYETKITELPKGEDGDENKKVIRYQRDTTMSQKNNEKKSSKNQATKNHVATSSVKRDETVNEELSEEEESGT
ncbi:unnamed protein product [Lasius platythorax]|uniref:Uncharacterized protein n=1 Tax=Lasius platythorax TaxID=488582 RepID=A0AAV2N4Z0_9HYME